MALIDHHHTDGTRPVLLLAYKHGAKVAKNALRHPNHPKTIYNYLKTSNNVSRKIIPKENSRSQDGRVPGVGLLFQNEQTDVVTDEEKVLIMNALTKTKCYFERFPIYSSIIPFEVGAGANVSLMKRQYYFDLLKK